MKNLDFDPLKIVRLRYAREPALPYVKHSKPIPPDFRSICGNTFPIEELIS